MKLASIALGFVASMTLITVVHAAPVPVATWNFNGTLNADEGGAPALTAINPLGANAFVGDTVFGNPQIVYQFNGNAFPVNEQAGVSVSTLGLLANPNAYSVDLIFKFNQNIASWESILGVSNRTSDNSFYVEPGNKLQVYPIGDGPTTFTFGQYHRISLTNNGANHVTAYLDGIFQFDLLTNVMNFDTYGGANPTNLMHFFADNTQGGGQGEFASGSVALIRLYDGELTRIEVRDLPTGNDVPEPGSLALMGLALVGLAASRRQPVGAA